MAISRIGTDGIDQTSSQQIGGISVGKGGGAVSTNTAVGASALAANTTGSGTTAIGYQSFYSGNPTQAVAVGYLTGYANTGNNVAFVGYRAGYNNTSDYTVAVGAYAADANTSGTSNVAMGYSALYLNTTGSYNSAIGHQALRANTTGSQSTAVGFQAGYSQTTNDNNTFIGFRAGYLTVAGTGDQGRYNTAMGSSAGSSMTTGYYNTLIGAQAGISLTTGYANTFIGGPNGTNGYAAGYYVTTGSKNVILGSYNGNQGGLDIRTASNYIVLSDGDGNPNALWNGSYLKTGAGASVGSYMSTGGYNELVNLNDNPALMASALNASNTSEVIQLRAARNTTNNTFYAFTYYNTGAAAFKFRVADSGNVTNTNNSYGAISDIKLKENIADATPKLEKLCQVRVVNYNFIGDEQKQLGVIAQELEQIFPAMVEESPDRDADNNDLGTTTKQVKYSVFVPMLIKAIQELKAEFDAYKEAHP